MAIVDGGIGERWVANEAALATHGGEAIRRNPQSRPLITIRLQVRVLPAPERS
jgi:hypothetical protein